MCYNYSLSIHCPNCGRQISHYLEIFCAGSTIHESAHRLDPSDRCHIGKDPQEYPRKDALFPGTAYQYAVWSELECEICLEDRNDNKKRDQTMGREQIRGMRSGRKDVDVQEINGNVRNGDSASQGLGLGKPKGPHLKKGKRALSRVERREKKAQVEKLFSDPRALEEQQRLFRESMGRMRRGGRA